MVLPPNNLNLKPQNISRFKSLLDDLKRRFSDQFTLSSQQSTLLVSLAEQQLHLIKNQEIISSYVISSAAAGIGNLSGSYQTPLGAHIIAEKFGENASIASIFKARKNTNVIAKILDKADTKSKNDNITSRILWLEGLEEGVNKGSDSNGDIVDTKSRYIYIHGTDEEGRLGNAVSHGCIRMANQDVIELFNKVNIGSLVFITED